MMANMNRMKQLKERIEEINATMVQLKKSCKGDSKCLAGVRQDMCSTFFEFCPEYGEDFSSFLYSYVIVSHMHERYKKEFGSIPVAVRKDMNDAKRGYRIFKEILGARFKQVVFERIATEYSAELALWYCAEMYNREMNDMFGSEFSPTSDDVFLGSNFLCTTSYEDALKNIHKFLRKYDYRDGAFLGIL